MLLPIGDEPNPESTPTVNYALIAINILVYLLVTLPLESQQITRHSPGVREYLEFATSDGRVSMNQAFRSSSEYDLFVFRYGYRPAAPSLITLFLSMFLHAGLMHLVGNMLFLWIFGDNIEHRLGSLMYLTMYLFTGICGHLFFACFEPGSSAPLIGASGAISGILGFYFVWFPENRVKMFFWFLIFIDVWRIPARCVLGFYLVIDNLLPFLFSHSGSGVAHGAHIGGFLAGATIAWWWDRQAAKATITRWMGEAGTDPDVQKHRASTDTLARHQRMWDALAERRLDVAAYEFFEAPAKDRASVYWNDVLAMATWLTQYGHGRTALAMLRDYLSLRREQREAGELYVLAGEILLSEQRPVDAYRYLARALPMPLSASVRERAIAGLNRIRSSGQ